MGRENNAKNQANQKEAKNSSISDFLGKEANCRISKTREILIRELIFGTSNDHLRQLIIYKKQLETAQLEQDLSSFELKADENIACPGLEEMINDMLTAALEKGKRKQWGDPVPPPEYELPPPEIPKRSPRRSVRRINPLQMNDFTNTLYMICMRLIQMDIYEWLIQM